MCIRLVVVEVQEGTVQFRRGIVGVFKINNTGEFGLKDFFEVNVVLESLGDFVRSATRGARRQVDTITNFKIEIKVSGKDNTEPCRVGERVLNFDEDAHFLVVGELRFQVGIHNVDAGVVVVGEGEGLHAARYDDFLLDVFEFADK